MGFEPTRPLRGTRFSKPVRPAVSGCPPMECRRTKHKMSKEARRANDECSCFELRNSFDIRASSFVIFRSGLPGSRTPISWLQARRRPVGPAARGRLSVEGSALRARKRDANRNLLALNAPLSTLNLPMIPDGVEPPFPGCRPGVVATGPRDRGRRDQKSEISGQTRRRVLVLFTDL